MQFKIGSVYRDAKRKIDFIATQENYEATRNQITFCMVNLANWIMVGRFVGKLMTSGEINCSNMDKDAYELVSPSIQEYYDNKKHTKR